MGEVARVESSVPIEWGTASAPQPGQSVSGDRFLVAPFDQGVLVAVVDGLGHGEQAAEAAEIAVETLRGVAPESVVTLVQRCHTALARSRGVVLTLALFDARNDRMTWLGVGNVEGLLLRAAPNLRRESVSLRGGVVGYQLPPLRESVQPIARGDTLILVTDGIRAAFSNEVFVNEPPQQIANLILQNYRRGTDDALVLVVRYLGGDA